MIIARINGVDIDIDDATAIGITLQAYDIKEPGKRKINITNTFTIPITAHNLAQIGYAGDPQFTSTLVYDAMYFDYWIDNEHLINNYKLRVMEVGERISLFVFQKEDVWDNMRLLKWGEFTTEFLAWLKLAKSYPSESSPSMVAIATFLNTYKNNTTGLVLPFFYGNLYNHVYNKIGDTKSFSLSETQTIFTLNADFTYQLTNWDSSGSNNVSAVLINGDPPVYPFLIEPGDTVDFEITKLTSGESADLSFFGADVYLEDKTNIWLKYYPAAESSPANGGHFCAFAKTIFEFIQYKYDVNFCVNEVGLAGNIWDDTYASSVYVPVRNIDVRFHYTGLSVTGFYFDTITGGEFLPETGLEDKPDKSLYDFVNAFFQHFNIIKDEIEILGEPAIKLSRFDDIKTLAPVVKFTGRFSGTPKFKPFVDGFAQENLIKFDNIYPEGNPLINSRTVTCLNKNLDATSDLFSIDSYIPAFVPITGGVIPDLSTTESFSTFEFLINSGLSTNSIRIRISEDSDAQDTSMQLYKAAIYSLSGEYTFLNEIMARPRFYEVQKWLTLNDIKAIEFFKQYFIQELNGSYFINKISGFNPKKSNEPTKIELIRISDKVAIDFKELEYWVDGLENNFTDGMGNKFF